MKFYYCCNQCNAMTAMSNASDDCYWLGEHTVLNHHRLRAFESAARRDYKSHLAQHGKHGQKGFDHGAQEPATSRPRLKLSDWSDQPAPISYVSTYLPTYLPTYLLFTSAPWITYLRLTFLFIILALGIPAYLLTCPLDLHLLPSIIAGASELGGARFASWDDRWAIAVGPSALRDAF